MFVINFCLNMFRASLCPSSGEQRPCYCIWCTALVLLDVVGSSCGALLASYNAEVMWYPYALLASYNAEVMWYPYALLASYNAEVMWYRYAG
jgi:hypothetical protein